MMTQFRGHRGDSESSGMTRAEDRSLWMRSAKMLEKYKLIWGSALLLFTAAGFDFKTPKSANLALQVQIDSLKRASELEIHDRQEIREILEKLTKVPCLAKDRNVRDLALIGITCPQLTDK
jgi:hypothetical protein